MPSQPADAPDLGARANSNSGADRAADASADEKYYLELLERQAEELLAQRAWLTALRESEQQQRRLIEGAPQLLWRASANGQWTWASPQWCAFTGLSDAASRGGGWLLAVHAQDRAAVICAWGDAQSNAQFHADLRLCEGSSGEHRWFRVSAAAARDELGNIVEWIGSCSDIHDLIVAREQLIQQRVELEAIADQRGSEMQRALDRVQLQMHAQEKVAGHLRETDKLSTIGKLTSGIVHDFNNVLQAVSGSLGIVNMLLQQGRTRDLEGYVQRAIGAVKRAAALSHRLLAFGGNHTPAPRKISLAAVVRDIEDLIRRGIGPDVQFELQLADSDWMVMCDPYQLENALLALCVNAREAMPKGGWLIITTREAVLSVADLDGHAHARPGRYAIVEVSDSGFGGDKESGGRAREVPATGNVSPLVDPSLNRIRDFVASSGGIVQIKSTPACGSTVRLCLPLREHDPQRRFDAATGCG